jgi:hypothetical protein
MQHLKFIVRWSDQEGNNKRKEYDSEPAARKAKQWLLDNGAASVDVAVQMGGREYKGSGGAIPSNAEPGIEQQSFIK